jgi:hypothetical protein
MMETSNSTGPSKAEGHGNTGAAVDAWNKPHGGHIPEPTYMPVMMALGMVCMLWGIVTTPLMSLVGAVLFVISITGWIGELRHEHRHPGSK